jgi:4-hydroxy-3-polyprenylbenzoate decarboxylase
VELNFVHDALLLVKVRGVGRPLLKKLVARKELSGVAIIALVSEDVDIEDRENYLWGLFTRFDCERDVCFTEQRMMGISPIYKGCMGIDATWKSGYPAPLVMAESIAKKVEERWDSYWT